MWPQRNTRLVHAATFIGENQPRPPWPKQLCMRLTCCTATSMCYIPPCRLPTCAHLRFGFVLKVATVLGDLLGQPPAHPQPNPAPLPTLPNLLHIRNQTLHLYLPYPTSCTSATKPCTFTYPTQPPAHSQPNPAPLLTPAAAPTCQPAPAPHRPSSGLPYLPHVHAPLSTTLPPPQAASPHRTQSFGTD